MVVSGIQDPLQKLIFDEHQHVDDLPGSFVTDAISGLSIQGPPKLQRASYRLQFPPSYVVVGIYRLVTDKSLLKPAWDKCKHGTQRGLVVGFVWVRDLYVLLPLDLTTGNVDVLHLPYPTEVYRAVSCPVCLNHFWLYHEILRRQRTSSSARVTGLSNDTFFGYKIPFNLTTCMSFSPAPCICILTLARAYRRCSNIRWLSNDVYPQLLPVS
jgi:hypothetical protein